MEQINNSLITANQATRVFNYFDNANKLLSSSCLYHFTKQNGLFQSAKYEIANFLSSIYEKNANEKFHKSLNYFQKLGFGIDDKVIKHQEKIGLNKFIIASSVEIILTSLPVLYDYFNRKTEVRNIKESVIGWIAYINKKNTHVIIKKCEDLYRHINEKFSIEEFINIFEKYANCNINEFKKTIDFENRYRFFNFIISCSDLNDPDILERCKEFGIYWLKLSENEVLYAISNVKDNEEYLSDISTFSGTSIVEVFGDLAQSISHAKEYSFYCFENDLYAQKRLQNRNKILNLTKSAGALALSSLSLYTGTACDALLIVSAPIINNLLNEENNFNQAISIQTKMKKMKEQLQNEH